MRVVSADAGDAVRRLTRTLRGEFWPVARLPLRLSRCCPGHNTRVGTPVVIAFLIHGAAHSSTSKPGSRDELKSGADCIQGQYESQRTIEQA